MTPRLFAVIAVLCVAIPANGAHAQQQAMPPLAEVARQAEAAKPTVKKAARTYTNSDLTADAKGEATPAHEPGAGFVSKSLGKPVSAEEMVTRSEAKVESDTLAKQSEDDWRARAAALRRQVDAIKEQVAVLSVPNALTDSNPAIKRSNDLVIANAQASLDDLKKRWARLEASAVKVKIPTEWILPAPQFQQ